MAMDVLNMIQNFVGDDWGITNNEIEEQLGSKLMRMNRTNI